MMGPCALLLAMNPQNAAPTHSYSVVRWACKRAAWQARQCQCRLPGGVDPAAALRHAAQADVCGALAAAALGARTGTRR